MRRSSTIGTGLQRTPSSGGSGESSIAKNRRTTLDQLATGIRSDDPIMQLADKERECERLEDELESLKAQLVLRPPKSELEGLKQENKELENLVAAYQRENEKATRLTEGIKARERQLEEALAKHIGPSWADMLEIPASPAPDRHLLPSSSTRTNLSSLAPSGLASTPIRPLNLLRQMSSSTATPTHLSQSFLPPSTPDSPAVQADETMAAGAGSRGMSRQEMDEMRAQVEGLRALMQGLERRVTRREGESAERLRRAEEEAERWRRGGDGGLQAA